MGLFAVCGVLCALVCICFTISDTALFRLEALQERFFNNAQKAEFRSNGSNDARDFLREERQIDDDRSIQKS